MGYTDTNRLEINSIFVIPIHNLNNVVQTILINLFIFVSNSIISREAVSFLVFLKVLEESEILIEN